jgi:hypothetical protein
MPRKPKTKAPPPAPKRAQLNVRLDLSLKEWIERLAAEDKRTVNNWVERALAHACEQFVRELTRREQADITAGGNPVRAHE